MVSINNSVGGLSGLNNSQPVVRPRTSNANNLDKQPKKDFSQLLDNNKKQNSTTKQVQKPAQDFSQLSPLMARYGVNKINEIKQIANETGVNDLTNADFDYAIRYGRSILADYIV